MPPVTVEAPVARKRPVATKPTAEQLRVRAALRRAARATTRRGRSADDRSNRRRRAGPDQDPYADPAAPYKADRLASQKFSEPIVNTPKSITVLTKELLAGQGCHQPEGGRAHHAGVTIGTGEGGNAFGDRFFIRGFDARNDVFVDGIRDPAVNIRENFFTEQIEILKGPSSTIDGRGTTGGALNIVTKQATTDRNFYNADTKFASDATKRVTFDVNQVINPTLAIRMDGMWQNADVVGARLHDRRPLGRLGGGEVDADRHFHTLGELHPQRSEWAARFRRSLQHRRRRAGHFVRRSARYLLRLRQSRLPDRDQQDIGTSTANTKSTTFVTLSNKFRDERSVLNYIGTIPEQGTGSNGSCNSNGGNFTNPNPANWMVCLNPLEPLSGDRRARRPDHRDVQVRHRAGPQHAGNRHRDLARNSQHRHLQRPELGGHRHRRVCQRLRRAGPGLESAQLS